MVSKKKIKYPVFVFSLFIGIGLMGIAFLQPEFIFGQTIDFDRFGGVDTSSGVKLDILEVPIDPVTGGILGTIKLGAPDIVPFEQSGTHISTLDTFCTENFGRRLSGERNLDPVWWASQPVSTTSTSKHCAYAYAQWDLVDIPNEFVATSVMFQLELVETTPMSGLNCLITFNDFNIDTVGEAALISKLRSQAQLILEGRPSSFPNTPDFVQDPNGAWCRTLGVKNFNFGQTGVDIVNKAIGGGAFDQGTRTDKLVLGFVPSDLGSNDGFAQQYRISNQFWATQGSWLITGSSPPISCDVGFNQVAFRCVPIICNEGMQVDITTNECAPIICGSDEVLQGNICVPLNCQIGEEIVAGQCQIISCPSGTELIASSCEALVCGEGFEISGNECTLKQCSIGMELIADNCQEIQCPVNTMLVGNDCLEISCPADQISIDNVCRTPDVGPGCENDQEIQDEECTNSRDTLILCVEGFHQVGNSFIPDDLNCPLGTEEFENVCVQRIPSLQLGSGLLDPNAFLIAGVIVAAMSVVGIIVRRI